MTEREKVAFESGYYAGYIAAETAFKKELSVHAELLAENNAQLIELIRKTAKLNGNSEEVEKQLAKIAR